ncbi:uncharacterized protein LOC123211313 isoform X2 [Mangifera indica]|uniref:uncharacterized protein LOC123211313 isoform X2 n=1 Tax=Mangifera indica TaxID=29780 RepID=UPI001CFA6A38|nr:uncharacterized protein LOC123211313 isoform X2 [Mangifera indica]
MKILEEAEEMLGQLQGGKREMAGPPFLRKKLPQLATIAATSLFRAESEMGSLVGLAAHIMPVEIITLLAEKRIHPNRSVPWINEVDIYQFDPSDLPALSETNSENQVWYFFVERYYKSAKSQLTHRKTRGGNWKITGQRRYVKDKGKVIGSKKTLVFCRRGRTSEEIETDWAMHEFYVKDSPRFEKNFVVCYIGKKRRMKSSVRRRKKSSVLTPDDGQPNLSLSSDYVTHVTENPSSEVESQRQQPMSQHMITDYWRHISENSFLQAGTNMPYQGEPPPPSSNNSVSEPINPFSEFSSEVGPQLLSSSKLDYDLRNHSIASSSSMVDSQQQQPMSQHMITDYWRHISENSFLQVRTNMPFEEEPPPPSSNNLVSEPINPFSEFSSEVGPQLLSNSELDYDLSNHFIAGSSSKVESQQRQPMSQHMITDYWRHISENSFLQVGTNMPYEEETPPPSSNNLVSEPINPFSEFSSEVGPQLLSNSELDYDLSNHFIAGSSSKVESQQRQPMSQHMITDYWRHISENSFLQVGTNMPYEEETPPPSSNNLVSEPINPFSEFSSEVGPQLLSNSELDYDLSNHFIAGSSSKVESQQPMGQHFISDSRQHISESSFLQVRKIMPYRLSSVSVIVFEKHIHTTNTLFVYDAFLQVETPPLSSNNLVSGPIIPFLESSSGVELQLLSSYELDYHLRNHFMPSSSSLMYPQQPDEIEEVSYYNWLNQSLDPQLQLPNNPHQGFNTSYANGISNNCNMGSYQFTGGLEDVVNLQRNVQN